MRRRGIIMAAFGLFAAPLGAVTILAQTGATTPASAGESIGAAQTMTTDEAHRLFGRPVDVVVRHAELPAMAAAMQKNPDLYEGLTVGVDMRVRNDEVMARGGAAAAAADEALIARQKAEHAQVPQHMPCANDPRRTADASVVYFACQGEEPGVYPLHRTLPDAEAHPAQHIAAALEVLRSGPSTAEANRGYYSSLQSSLPLVRGVKLDQGKVILDFDAGTLGELGLGDPAASASFLRQVAATALASSQASTVEFWADGTCQSFSSALGDSEGCVSYTDEELAK